LGEVERTLRRRGGPPEYPRFIGFLGALDTDSVPHAPKFDVVAAIQSSKTWNVNIATVYTNTARPRPM
jgi:hypothetical protein